ncbi:MAG: alpha/beta fold hydrolase [Opitutaceae bacterium]
MSPVPPLPPYLARLYPFEPKRFATPAGAAMSYLDEGPRSEEAVVMLHGNPTWSFHYRHLVRALAPGRRCIVPDHVGMGLSDHPPDYDYGLSRRIDDVAALIGWLGLKRVDLVVHDWGGAIGCGWAVRHPERVGRIALLNTAAFPSRHVPRRIALCRMPVLGELWVRGANGFAGPAVRMAMRARALERDERRAYLHPYDSWAHRIAVHRFVRDIPLEADHPSRPVLEDIAHRLPGLAGRPILLAWGAKDFCFDLHFLSRWREIFPQAEVEIYPRAGHFVLEDAAPEIVDRLREFLRP